ncbi:MAG TPA: nucleotidyltransferase family protein [Terriglobales bacterium]|nr:nucleotidyltransferase family protein [Terriglobales bacterium]
MPLIASSSPEHTVGNGMPALSSGWAEFSFLLGCCSLDDARRESLLPALAAALDWSQLLDLAEHHGVIPLVYRSLRDFSRLVPADVLENFRSRYEENARKNLCFQAELVRILACLEAHDIVAVPFKGPVLAETVYRDLALRSFSDLDVLVEPADVPRAKVALATLGYAPALTLSAAEERAYIASAYEYVFDGPAGRNLLELQWGIVPRFYAMEFDVAGLVRRASPTTVGSFTMRRLTGEDLLLALSVHAAKHLWSRVCWLRDLAGVVATHPFDVDSVERQAAELGIERILAMSVLLANRLLASPVPEPWKGKWQNDGELCALCDQLEQHLVCAPACSPESLGYFRWMMRLRERPADRCKLLSRLALTPGVGEWSLVRLPGPLFPLYRVVRVFRLARRILPARGRS